MLLGGRAVAVEGGEAFRLSAVTSSIGNWTKVLRSFIWDPLLHEDAPDVGL